MINIHSITTNKLIDSDSTNSSLHMNQDQCVHICRIYLGSDLWVNETSTLINDFVIRIVSALQSVLHLRMGEASTQVLCRVQLTVNIPSCSAACIQMLSRPSWF